MSLLPLQHIDAKLAWMKPQLQVTVFSILAAWVMGFILPTVFLL